MPRTLGTGWQTLADRAGGRAQLVGALVLLVAAAALRLNGLGDEILRLDEAVAAELAAPELTLAEVLRNTRLRNSSPIGYPLLLHVVQQFDGGAWAIRIAPAIASICVVAALLFLLPRAGVSHAAAWLAAAMATFSVPAIRHAQDAREYSIDSLMAVLLAVGLLRALRGQRPTLLCVALLIAPFIQYGLGLLGAAVVLTLAVSRGRDALRKRRWAAPATWRRSWRRMLAALAPFACFAVGGFASWAVTLRMQRGGIAAVGEGYYGAAHLPHLYAGELGDAVALGQFAATKLWSFFSYHIPEPVVVLGLAAVAAVVCLRVAGRRPLGPIPLLFGVALGAALAAAALRLYPLGGVRQTLYLAPIAFIALGHAMHDVVAGLPQLPRRAVRAVVAGLIVVVGVGAVAAHPWRARGAASSVLAELDRHVGAAAAYVPYRSGAIARFYLEGRENLHFGRHCSWDGNEACRQRLMADLLRLRLAGVDQLWLVSFNDEVGEVRKWVEAGTARVVAENGWFELFEVPDLAAVLGREAAAMEALRQFEAWEVTLRPRFDAWLHYAGRRVVYGMAPCHDQAGWGRFMLRVTPEDRADLPAERQPFGTEELDFGFNERGVKLADACLAVAPLPDYPIHRVDVGQWVPGGGYLVWSRSFRVWVARIAAASLAQAPTPAMRDVFDVHMHDGQLIYAKERCGPADRQQRFFYRATPSRAEDLPALGDAAGYDPVDFSFGAYGVVDGTRCLVVRRLPGHPITTIETGQLDDDGLAVWSGMFTPTP